MSVKPAMLTLVKKINRPALVESRASRRLPQGRPRQRLSTIPKAISIAIPKVVSIAIPTAQLTLAQVGAECLSELLVGSAGYGSPVDGPSSMEDVMHVSLSFYRSAVIERRTPANDNIL